MPHDIYVHYETDYIGSDVTYDELAMVCRDQEFLYQLFEDKLLLEQIAV